MKNTPFLHLVCPNSNATNLALSIIWCDNISIIFLASNSVFHTLTEHIEIDYHSIFEKVIHKNLVVPFIWIQYQLADIFIRGLTSARFSFLRDRLMVHARPISLRRNINRSSNKESNSNSNLSPSIKELIEDSNKESKPKSNLSPIKDMWFLLSRQHQWISSIKEVIKDLQFLHSIFVPLIVAILQNKYQNAILSPEGKLGERIFSKFYSSNLDSRISQPSKVPKETSCPWWSSQIRIIK